MIEIKLKNLTLVVIIASCLLYSTATAEFTDSLPSADLPLEARDADSSSQEEDLISTSYVLPNQIFNDGKPYYASKDPVSGQLDFNAKKPAGIQTAANEVFDPKEKIILSSSSPNIHDYLNLPVKYSSSKFVYPLVSSSYANLKYQGSNKNYITNKKPTSVVAPITPPPSYHSQNNGGNNYYTVPTTKLMAVLPTAAGSHTTSPNSTSKAQPSTTTQSSTSTITTTTTTTTIPPSKYTTTSRKPTTVITTTSPPRTSTTRKKFIPTKKYSSTITTMSTATTPLRFRTQPALNSSTTTSATTTTRQPAVHTQPQSHPPFSHPSTAKPSTAHPIIFTESPFPQPSFSPLPNSTPRPPRVHDMEPADIYQTLGQKNNHQEFEQKPSMTLADIFNSLAEEESAVLSHNQGNQGIDAQGNLIQPISLSKPAPFAAQQSRPQNSMHPAVGATPTPPLSVQQQKQHLPHEHQQPLAQNEQKVISGSQENYSNEYVSYQVQQPNVMQYRPVPGTINNVVISPGQNSATFVLGSQQQVGVTNTFGSVEKEPLFSKEPPVQYGTVINEDISSLQRIPDTSSSKVPNTIQHMPASQMNSNFHQNGGNTQHSVVGSDSQFMQKPGDKTFHEAAPVPPSPYQQLPLINSNKRPLMKPQQEQHTNPIQTFPSQNQQEQQSPQTQAIYQQNVPSSPFPQMTRPQNAPLQQPQQKPTSINISGEQATQELLVSTNIRFPETDETSVEVSSGPVMTGPPVGPQINGHAQPLSLQQIQQSNPVVFPKGNENDIRLKPPTPPVNAHNTQPSELPYQTDIQIQQHEVLTMNQHKQKLNFPQNVNEPSTAPVSQHIPSQHMEPPPRFPPALHSAPASTELQDPHKRPQTNRPHPISPHTPAYKYSDYTRKPIPSITRSNPEHHLPNILPQFRPNAKVSSGHPSSYNHEPGNIRIPTNLPPKRPMNSPQFAHRHQSMPQAQQQLQHHQRYPMKRIAEYPTSEANRRVYRLPPPHAGGQYPQFADRMYARRPTSNGPPSDSFNSERHALSAQNNEPYMPSVMPETSLDKLAAFAEEDLVINDPPQPVTPSKDYKIVEEETLEPVVTLQMLQSQKKGPVSASLAPNDDSGEIQVPSANGAAGMPPYQKETSSQNGLYVVYPMREETGKLNSNEAVDLKDTLPGIAHIEGASTTGSGEYQNTPFSVLRDQPQEPILMVKNKKPQSLQQQTKQAHQQAAKDKFPYPIEKPDLRYSEDSKMNNRMPGLIIAPRIINGAYVTGTAAPIAIAYTPTEPNPYRHHATHQKRPQSQSAPANQYSNVNLAASVIGEIRPSDTQTEEGFNNDLDLRGQNYENDFMAPFHPSVSLGSATNKPSNGWNILSSTTESALYLKNLINRADVGEAKYEAEALETTTKSFELDSFQPELQGGFQPIYPPGYKEEAEEVRLHDGENSPVALASHGDPPTSAKPPTKTTTTVTSTTTTTTTKPKLKSSTPSTTTTRIESESLKNATNISTSPQQMPTSTSASIPTTPRPTPRTKSAFESSLAALLFGEEEDFEDQMGDGEARKDNTIHTVSEPHNSTVPRSGPRSLKLS